MTKLHDPTSSPLRLRATSDRAIRQLHLVWLLGWTTDKIADGLGVGPGTVCRRLRRHGLRTAEAEGEIDHLIACEVRDRTADALLTSIDPLAKELVAIQSKLNTGPRPRAATPETVKDKDATHTDDWRFHIAADLERLARMDTGLAPGSADGAQDEETGGVGDLETKSAVSASASSARPGYSSSAAGSDADMVAFWRTWRWQDARRCGMGALGGAAGGLSQCGAGGADLLGRARSDDRGGELPAVDGDRSGRPAGLATVTSPA